MPSTRPLPASQDDRRPAAPAASPPPPESERAEAEIASYVARAQSRAVGELSVLSAFQRRIEQFPQLSASAQLELHAQFRAGEQAERELEALRAEGWLSSRSAARTERQLQERVRAGKRAEEYLVGSNFRLVLLICREHAEERFGRERGMEVMSDLVAEANVALTEAVRSYDQARCSLFTTYAARVVRDRVRMTLANEGPLRLAPSWSRLKRIASVRIPQLAADLGRQPTDAEIKADLFSRCMEWAATKLTDEQQQLPAAKREQLMVAKLRKQGMLGAINSLQDILVVTQAMTSLDATVGDDGSALLSDLLSETSPDGFDEVELSELRQTLDEALRALSDRDRHVILLRFGFIGGERRTYAAIGEELKVTAERIRQIERGVLERLAGPNPSRDRLAAFLPTLDDEGSGAPVRAGRPGVIHSRPA